MKSIALLMKRWLKMDCEVFLEQSALFDFRDIAFYEAQFTLSIEKSRENVHGMVDEIIAGLEFMPSRYPEREYGFTDALRRVFPIGKYSAFYWIDEEEATVHVERVLHSQADFSRIHFGN